jgi:hypothetical protein
MPARPRPWIVTRHDPIRKLEDNLWTVDGDLPGVPGSRRRMTIVRRGDGALVFFNAMPLDDDALNELHAWGTPRWLVLPNRFHKIDAHAFRARLGVALLCAAEVADAVRALTPVDGHLEDLPPDPTVRLARLTARQGEVALVTTSGARTSVGFGDAFMNVPPRSGFLNAVLGVSGRAKCPPLFRAMFVRDRPSLARDLAALARLPGLTRLIPSHGDLVTDHPAQVLEEVIARDLSPR